MNADPCETMWIQIHNTAHQDTSMNTFVVIIQEQTMDRIASKAKLEVKRSEEEWGRTFYQPQSSSLGNHIWASSSAFS
jgi:hypothetical protein